MSLGDQLFDLYRMTEELQPEFNKNLPKLANCYRQFLEVFRKLQQAADGTLPEFAPGEFMTIMNDALEKYAAREFELRQQELGRIAKDNGRLN